MFGVVFTTKELEKHPDAVAGAAGGMAAQLPPLGSAADRGEGESRADLDAAQAALLRVRAACAERSIDLRPAFSEHDELVPSLTIYFKTYNSKPRLK